MFKTMTKPNITPGEWTWQATGRGKVLPPLHNLVGFTGEGLAKTILSTEREMPKSHPDSVAIKALPAVLYALERAFQKMEVQEMDGRLGHSSEYLIALDALTQAGYTFEP